MATKYTNSKEREGNNRKLYWRTVITTAITLKAALLSWQWFYFHFMVKGHPYTILNTEYVWNLML
jgi:hypothetical protein